MLRSLLIGSAGGLLCWFAGVPAPWLAGSMIAAAVAGFAGIGNVVPGWLKTCAFILLGIQIGTSVTWETVERAARWPVSILFLGATVIAITWACHIFYIRRRWDGPTALFASLPGALSLVLLLAEQASADMRRVAIAQCIRLFFLVAALPALISLISPEEPVRVVAREIGTVGEIAVLVAASAVAGLLCEWLKVPAGLIMGPIAVGAIFELTGVVSGAAPMSLLIPANIVLGVMIAARISEFSLGELRAALGDGALGFLVALVIAVAGASIASWAAGLPLALTLLAFAPGGLEAMTIMAFALDLDPAYVAAHQVARYLGLALTMPLVTGFVLRRMARR